jgi:class 3 adenylate cyclase
MQRIGHVGERPRLAGDWAAGLSADLALVGAPDDRSTAEGRDPTLPPMQRRSGGRGLGAVLFTDIVGSTAIVAEMGNTRWSELVSRHHRIVRRLLGRFDGHEVDTAGDGFFVAFERPADAIRCAVAATEEVRELGIEIRAGVSFGELETVGRKPSGLVVNTAARVMAVAGPGEVLVPGSVKELVPGAGISFADHGVHRLKGFEEEFRLFSVIDVDGREIFPTGARRWALLVGAGVGTLVLVAVAWVLLVGGEPERRPGARGPLQHAVARIDPASGAVRSQIPLGGPGPGGYTGYLPFIARPLAVGEGALWLLRPPVLLHVDPLHEEVRAEPIDVGIGVSETVDVGFDVVWTMIDRTLYRVNPATDELEVALVLPPTGGISTYSLGIANAVWVGVSDGTLVRLDPRSGARDQADTGAAIDALAATKDGVWVFDILAGQVLRVDPSSLRPVGDPIEVEGSFDEVTTDGRYLWVLDRRVGVVTRVDASSNRVTGSARVGDGATSMATGGGDVWIGDRGGSLYRIDASTMQVSAIHVGAEVIGVAFDKSDGTVWVYLGKSTRTSFAAA